MYFEEFLKSDLFDIQKLNKEIDSDEFTNDNMTKVSNNLIEIRHRVAIFHHCDDYKNSHILKIFDTLKTHFKNDDPALSHITTMYSLSPSEFLAKKLNQKYQNNGVLFESKFHYDDWGPYNHSAFELLLCRKVQY